MSLFSFIEDMTQGVIGQIAQYGQQIENEALSPVRTMIDQVSGGVWRGKGADAFVNEMSGVVVPEVGRLIASLTGGGGFVSGLNDAMNIVNEFDGIAEGIGNALGDLFDGIF